YELGIVCIDTFYVDKKECLVHEDRAAQQDAILISGVPRSGLPGLLGEKFVGIQPSALSKPPAAAMEVVSAALQHHVDYRSAVAAEFGGIAVVLHLELLHDLN